MCDSSEKLVAWLDHELPANEAVQVERHLDACSECRGRLDAYKEVSAAFDAYCDAASWPRARRSRALSAAIAAGAVAALLALFLVQPRVSGPPHARITPPPANPPTVVRSPASSSATVTHLPPSPMENVRHRHLVATAPRPDASWPPAEPAVQIAIPAEALFPPGATPEGVSFVADLSIAPDGSAQRLRLRPQLIGLERSQP